MAEGQPKYDPRSVVREKYPALSVAERNAALAKSYELAALGLLGVEPDVSVDPKDSTNGHRPAPNMFGHGHWGPYETLMAHKDQESFGNGVKEGMAGMPPMTTVFTYEAPFLPKEEREKIKHIDLSQDELEEAKRRDRTRNGRLPDPGVIKREPVGEFMKN